VILLQLAFAGLAFLIGAIPFSLWVGKFALDKDIRDYGDGNPGASNVIRAGGLKWGGVALMLDISKGAAPVGLAAQVFGWGGFPLVVIAIMPVLGHAFSPFLNFNGGKAIATSAGIWIGLTLITVPFIGMVALTFWFFTLTKSAWATMFTAFTVMAYLLLSGASVTLITICALNWAVLAYRHRHELHTLPELRLFHDAEYPGKV